MAFQNGITSVTDRYDFTDATWEVLIMVLGAMLIGYLLHCFFPCRKCGGGSTAAAMPAGIKKDDLKIVEGIGPKIEELLHNAGIATWRDLGDASTGRLQEILDNAGERFRMHDPSTWAEQSGMAADGKWDELEEYQNFLVGGKDFTK